MKLSSEVKIGLIGIVTLAVLIWGINYLKGRNILKNSYTLHVFYADARGLESSAPVVLNGVKVGYVDEVVLWPGEELPVEVVLHIENDFRLPAGSSAVMFSADLLGTKAIRMEASGAEILLQDHDTVPSMLEIDLIGSLQAQIMPAVERIGELAVTLDRLAGQMDTLISSESTRATIHNLSNASESLSNLLQEEGSVDRAFSNMESFTATLREQEEHLASVAGHLSSVSESLDSAGVGALAAELRHATGQLNLILDQINSGEGNAGKLIYSDSLYLNLESLVSNLDNLVRDLNENPESYVHFSLFGNSQKRNR